jgi:hypothetical protein
LVHRPRLVLHPGVVLHARLARHGGSILHSRVTHLPRLGFDICREDIKLDDIGLAREQLVYRREQRRSDLAIEMLFAALLGCEEIDDREYAGPWELHSVPEQRVGLGFDEGECALQNTG